MSTLTKRRLFGSGAAFLSAVLTTIVSNLLFDDTDLLVVVVAALACVALFRLGRPGEGLAGLLLLVVPIVGVLVVVTQPRQPIGWMYPLVGTVLMFRRVTRVVEGITDVGRVVPRVGCAGCSEDKSRRRA